jgi:hypothetical protein
MFGKQDIAERHDMVTVVIAPASRCQSAAGVAVVVDLHDRDRLADDECVSGERDAMCERCECPELRIVGVGSDDDLLDERVEARGEVRVASCALGAGRRACAADELCSDCARARAVLVLDIPVLVLLVRWCHTIQATQRYPA